jgi:uncharacterized protein involved in cysteine biosynthesis
VGFLLKTPRTKRYAAAPVAIAAVLFVVFTWLVWSASEPLRRVALTIEWMPHWMQSAIAFILGAITITLLFVLTWFTAAAVVAAVAAPFLDLLVARVDEVRTGQPRAVTESWSRAFLYSLTQSGLFLLLVVAINLAAFAIAWLPPAGPVLSFVLLAFGAGLGAFDLAASRRRFGISQKLRVAGRHAPALAGFGTAAVLMAMIPCLGWLITIPACATGGALLIYNMDLTAAQHPRK